MTDHGCIKRSPRHGPGLILPGMAAVEESGYLALLRALDEPGELRQAAGLEFPKNFDRAATQRRFERLAARLSDVFGSVMSAGMGPFPEASLFGELQIPADFTMTRAKRTRISFPVIVAVSNFGNLATCWPARGEISPGAVTSATTPLHPIDRSRVEQVLNELGYVFVPEEVLEIRYDGPNQWVFGGQGETWFDRTSVSSERTPPSAALRNDVQSGILICRDSTVPPVAERSRRRGGRTLTTTEHQARDGCRAGGKLREPLSHDVEWALKGHSGAKIFWKGPRRTGTCERRVDSLTR